MPAEHLFAITATLGFKSVTQTFVVKAAAVVEEVATEVAAADAGTTSVTVDAPLSPIRGAGILLPEGALSIDTVLSIGQIQQGTAVPGAAQTNAGDNDNGTSAVVSFGPSGTQFSEPVTLALPLGNIVASGPIGAESVASKVQAWTMDDDSVWKRLPVSHVDTEAGVAIVKTHHFSQFTAFVGEETLLAPSLLWWLGLR